TQSEAASIRGLGNEVHEFETEHVVITERIEAQTPSGGFAVREEPLAGTHAFADFGVDSASAQMCVAGAALVKLVCRKPHAAIAKRFDVLDELLDGDVSAEIAQFLFATAADEAVVDGALGRTG